MSRIAVYANIHSVTQVEANSVTGVDGGLKLAFSTGNYRDGHVEYCFFLGDQVLSDRLAASINEIMKARKAELAEPEAEDAPANEYVEDDAQFGVGA